VSKHIDPIYMKIKKFNKTHSSRDLVDTNLSLDVKHKLNNDITYLRDKLKENKLKNLIK